jgi:hypothetical protein
VKISRKTGWLHNLSSPNYVQIFGGRGNSSKSGAVKDGKPQTPTTNSQTFKQQTTNLKQSNNPDNYDNHPTIPPIKSQVFSLLQLYFVLLFHQMKKQ